MKNIVVIAHDAKKPELVRFLNERTEWLRGVKLLATGRTAEYLKEHGIECEHLNPGESGGYKQITSMRPSRNSTASRRYSYATRDVQRE